MVDVKIMQFSLLLYKTKSKLAISVSPADLAGLEKSSYLV
jgi:hypothetical protein